MIYSGKTRVTSPFGWRTMNGVREHHSGIDVVGTESKEIRAVCGGEVIASTIVTDKANRTWEWGNYVCVKGTDGMYYYYCHMSERRVLWGQAVSAGDVIGVEGQTGYSFGSHCHFEVRDARGVSVDPSPYLGVPNAVGIYDVGKDETEDKMDAKTFKAMFDEMRGDLRDNDSAAYSEDARRWATETGLIGGSGTVDGEPNYMWQDFLTREQLVTVLYRFANLIGGK